DWWHGRPLGDPSDYTENKGNTTIYGSFRIITDKLRKLNPKATILLITPMQRVDFVYLRNPKNNAYGSYREKNGQTLEQVANAIVQIGKMDHLTVIDLFHNKKLPLSQLVKFKRLKDPKTGLYTQFPYPAFVDVPFNPEADEYPYPPESIGLTYDGLHPSDAGNEIIAHQIVKQFKKRHKA
ncbi:MAG: hypothetical protein LWW85_01470, partial [Marinilabiliales bacterium]|nr:hypothetical protein [Marinilabiliales bacterium]